jgi:hypothetical protein
MKQDNEPDLAAQGKAIHLATNDGDVEISEEQLPLVTDADLAEFRISREELRRVFAEGQRLMREQGVKPSDRTRACAHEIKDGKWEVLLRH